MVHVLLIRLHLVVVTYLVIFHKSIVYNYCKCVVYVSLYIHCNVTMAPFFVCVQGISNHGSIQVFRRAVEKEAV